MAAGALGSVHNRLRHQNGDTHVVGFDDVFSDAGSTPAASTIFRFFLRNFAQFSFCSRRLQNLSTVPVRTTRARPASTESQDESS
jgi:hypothetical protein